jgi:lipoyl(octanoyl) transferase
MTKKVLFKNLEQIDFKDAWDFQEGLFKKAIDLKMYNRKHESDSAGQLPENHFLFCEHPHVYTLGKSGSADNLLIDDEDLKQKQATYYKINRGGDITYHGPGQIVGYPILDLDQFFTDIHRYLRTLEEVIIKTMAEYGLKGERYPGFTGVWLDPESERARKICAMGVRTSRWVTMHGFAFNVNTDLNYFNNIVPCGIDDKDVTSMERELGEKLPLNEVQQKVKKHFSQLFEVEFVE